MSNYQKIKKMVLPFLESFKDDLLIHDKEDLEYYEGDFLYGFRPCGTNNFKLDLNGYNLEKDLVTQANNSKIFLIGSNKWFLYCKKGEIKSITKDELNKIFEEYLTTKLIPFQEKIKKLNIPMIAMDIFYFIKTEKRSWKLKLKNSNCDILQKLKNNFDLKVLAQINQNTKEVEIQSLLYKNVIVAKDVL